MIQGTPGNDPPLNLAGGPSFKARGYWGWEVRRLPNITKTVIGKKIIIERTEFTGRRKWYPGTQHPSQLRGRTWP